MSPPGAGDDDPSGDDSATTVDGSDPLAGNDGADSRESGTDGESLDWRVFARDVVSSAVAVLLVGVLLFAVSGVWPPMVAVESPSMTPNMKTGDLVFVMEAERFPGEGAHGETGVVTARTGETADVDYTKFSREGDVIVYTPDGDSGRTPIIHRAMFWVEEGENWYEKADRQSIGRYAACGDTPDEALPNCPAPHAGFVTKGDANGVYDQAQELSEPVRPEWVVGTAELRVPALGCVRLRNERCFALFTPSVVAASWADGTVSATQSPAVASPGSPEWRSSSVTESRTGLLVEPAPGSDQKPDDSCQEGHGTDRDDTDLEDRAGEPVSGEQQKHRGDEADQSECVPVVRRLLSLL